LFGYDSPNQPVRVFIDVLAARALFFVWMNARQKYHFFIGSDVIWWLIDVIAMLNSYEIAENRLIS
jgi:hypothetical protein